MLTDDPQREHPSAYIVQDRTHPDEMRRLEIQDKMLTAGMGGPLPEIADQTSLKHVLDVGCGTGGWLVEMARTYPSIEKLIGADISDRMLEYARERLKHNSVSAWSFCRWMPCASWNFARPILTL